jgi:transcription elongation factor Elf1
LNSQDSQQQPNPRPDLSFTPVRNGMDYLDRAVTELTEGTTPPDERRLKYAVLHLQAATEVLLKARLIGEHWSLVFKNLTKADLGEFNSGDFESCTTDETIDRLIKIAQVAIPADARDAIKSLAKDRNRLTHYGHTGSAYFVEARAARVLSFLLDFINGQLHPMLEDDVRKQFQADWADKLSLTPNRVYERMAAPDMQVVQRELQAVDETMRDLRVKLGRIEKLVDERMNALSGELASLKHRTVHCPDCRQLAFVVDEGKSAVSVSCRFCLSTYANAVWAAIEYTVRVLGEDNGAVDDCPYCSEECLVIGASTAESPSEDVALCFACAATFRRADEAQL